jgi:pyruvate formate lyase activating enzyme
MTDVPATPLSTLLACHTAATDVGLQYVYLGNIGHGDYDNTYCPACKNLLIERHGFSATIKGFAQGRCSQCGAVIPIQMG